MSDGEMTSLERTEAALSHTEPDRVPLFLNLTMHGARETGLSIREYYGDPAHVVLGQERLRERYGGDSMTGFCYGAAEAEAFGGETIFYDDGPPNAGAPPVRDIESLEAPDPTGCPALVRMLTVTRILADRYGDAVPIAGVAISPFSLPVMQLGFERYLDLLLADDPLFWRLMEVNREFSITWASLQIEAGATAIVYFDPVSSPTIITPDLARKTGLAIAKEVIREIPGPVAYHLASGRALPIARELIESGAVAVGVSALESLADLKEAFRGEITLIGNLDGILMRNWSMETATRKVREAITMAAADGGFILSDNHGEIPWQVQDPVIRAIADAAHLYGRYQAR